jgi:hypothetical protein
MANGDIRPSRFVQVDSSADHKGIEATANVPVIGIAMESSNYPPLSDLSITVLAASAGQYFRMYGAGEQCLVEAGAAITRNDKLKATANGRAEPIDSTTTTLQHWGAIALSSAAAAGELIPVQVMPLMSERGVLV